MLRIAVRWHTSGRSLVDIVYAYTGITAAGNAFVDGFSEGPHATASLSAWTGGLAGRYTFNAVAGVRLGR